MAEHANRKDRGKKLGLRVRRDVGLRRDRSPRWCCCCSRRSACRPSASGASCSGGAVPGAVGAHAAPQDARDRAVLGPGRGRRRGAAQVIDGPHRREGPRRRRRAPTTAPGTRCSPARARVFGAALLWLVYDVVLYSGVLFGPSVIAGGHPHDRGDVHAGELRVCCRSPARCSAARYRPGRPAALTAIGFAAAALAWPASRRGWARPAPRRPSARDVRAATASRSASGRARSRAAACSGSSSPDPDPQHRPVGHGGRRPDRRHHRRVRLPALQARLGMTALMYVLSGVAMFGAAVHFVVVPETGGPLARGDQRGHRRRPRRRGRCAVSANGRSDRAQAPRLAARTAISLGTHTRRPA